VNFGDILDEWDRETAKPCGKKKIREAEKRSAETASSASPGGATQATGKPVSDDSTRRVNPMDAWLRRYGTVDKDSELSLSQETVNPAEARRKLRSMKPEAIIDLHGLTRDDAWRRLESFVADSVRRGLKKILIIHGKGTHSAEDPVLRGMVRLFLEQNHHAGESGSSDKDSGGSGATWVILK
jgi:DNA-nicking Smr family endonuclease